MHKALTITLLTAILFLSQLLLNHLTGQLVPLWENLLDSLVTPALLFFTSHVVKTTKKIQPSD